MSFHPYYTNDKCEKCARNVDTPVLREIAASHQTGDSNLLAEVRALRADIAELKDALRTVPGLIVTGQRALDEFKRLTGESK